MSLVLNLEKKKKKRKKKKRRAWRGGGGGVKWGEVCVCGGGGQQDTEIFLFLFPLFHSYPAPFYASKSYSSPRCASDESLVVVTPRSLTVTH